MADAKRLVGFEDPVRKETHFTPASAFSAEFIDRLAREGRVTVERDWFYGVVGTAIVGHDMGAPVRPGGELTCWIV